MILNIRPAKREEARWLTSRLRFEDRREVETVRGTSTFCLSDCLDLSDETYAVRFTLTGKPDRHPTALFGVSEQDGWGIPWFLAAQGVERGALALLREAPHWIDAWMERYPNGLHNLVDSRNTLHVRWLRAAGFHFDGSGVLNDVDFIHFIRSNHRV